MAFASKPLADGQVQNTLTAAYTVPSLTIAYVKNVRVFNTSATPQTILLYINVSGTDRLFARVVLAQNEYADMLVEPLMLNAADVLKLQSTTTNVVDYLITGVEET
jgi:hypothetical protein